MLVKEIMTPNLITISPESSLLDAAQKMRIHNIGVLPVCEGAKLCGVITDRDLAIRGVANGSDFTQTKVQTIMTTQCVTCTEDDDLEKAVDLMEARSVRRVIVTGSMEKARPVGIISLDDIARKSQDLTMSGRAFMRLNKKKEVATAGIHAASNTFWRA
jgi:CBS domain-containing protein